MLQSWRLSACLAECPLAGLESGVKGRTTTALRLWCLRRMLLLLHAHASCCTPVLHCTAGEGLMPAQDGPAPTPVLQAVLRRAERQEGPGMAAQGRAEHVEATGRVIIGCGVLASSRCPGLVLTHLHDIDCALLTAPPGHKQVCTGGRRNKTSLAAVAVMELDHAK
jgi:hypothetical protein